MSTNDRAGNPRLHFSHNKNLIEFDSTITPVFNGLYRYKNAEQATTAGSLRLVVHDVPTDKPVSSTAYNTANTAIDIKLPKSMHYVQKLDVQTVLNNGDASANYFRSLPSNLNERYEIMKGSEIYETVTDLDCWLDKVIYQDPWEQDRSATGSYYDNASHVANSSATIAAAANSNKFSIPVPCVLSRCGIPLAACNDEFTLRLRTAVSSQILLKANATVVDLRLMATEVHGDENKLQRLANPNLDWRYLKAKWNHQDVAFTSGSTADIKLENYTSDDLCSHMWVFIRSTGLIGTDKDDMLGSVVSKIWLENQGGHSMTNGIQWSHYDLINFQFPDKFHSTANENHACYLVHCPAMDPVSDYRHGTMSGAEPLEQHMRLRITAAATGTYHVSVGAMCHRHVRLQNGNLQRFDQ